MKILIDTNVLIAASRYSNGIPFKALSKAINPPNRLVICEQNLEELKNVYNRKFPDDMYILEDFFDTVMPFIKIITIPPEKSSTEKQIRHVKDRPILRAAVAANVDIIISGDSDFLESGIKKPKILTPAEFIK